ncbi:hypothetical protein BC835DRAFT_1524571 [Cytidiella melzeri]|nr:hypothetical protein BC835DRAFT_1524571 [Cytidiella melzeri]
MAQVHIAQLQKIEYILIRDEYKYAYAHIDDAHRHYASTGWLLGYAVTGQPGIGKSTFLAYVLRERLQRKLPTAVEMPGKSSKYVLFSNQGVEVYKHNELPYQDENARLANVWALSNSTSATPTPCNAFRLSHAVLIQATPPIKQRWRKRRFGRLYVMDVWTPGEIGAVLEKIGFDTTRGQQLVNKYGPCAQTIFSLMENPAEEANVVAAITAAVTKVVANVHYTPTSWIVSDRAPDGDVPYLLFLRPESREIRGMWRTYIPTTSMVSILADAIVAKPIQEQSLLFRNLTLAYDTKSVTGCLFENFMHTHFTTAGEPTMFCFDKMSIESRITGFTSHHFIAGTFAQLQTSTPPFYWRPGSREFLPGIDSVLSTPDILWVFQANIGHRSGDVSVNRGLKLLARHLGPKAVGRMRLVVVGSIWDDLRAVVDSMGDIWQNIPAYTCQLIFGVSESMVGNYQAQIEGTHLYDSSFLDADESETGDEDPLTYVSSKEEVNEPIVEPAPTSSRKRKIWPISGPSVTTRSMRRKTGR